MDNSSLTSSFAFSIPGIKPHIPPAMAPARIAIGIAMTLGKEERAKATAVVAIIPMAICPSAPILFIPQREETQIPRAMIVSGIILTKTSENVLKLEKGIDMIME